MDIRTDDLSGAATQALLRLHLAGMHENTPADHVHALDLSGLQKPEITVWTAWDDEILLGIGALRRLDAQTGEVKSMRTHPDHLRRGVAARILDHIIGVARSEGLSRLSLETGAGAAFEPALTLYRRRGFHSGAAFGDYAPSPFSQFLHLEL